MSGFKYPEVTEYIEFEAAHQKTEEPNNAAATAIQLDAITLTVEQRKRWISLIALQTEENRKSIKMYNFGCAIGSRCTIDVTANMANTNCS